VSSGGRDQRGPSTPPGVSNVKAGLRVPHAQPIKVSCGQSIARICPLVAQPTNCISAEASVKNAKVPDGRDPPSLQGAGSTDRWISIESITLEHEALDFSAPGRIAPGACGPSSSAALRTAVRSAPAFKSPAAICRTGLLSVGGSFAPVGGGLPRNFW
jgi:hypothetical protein